MDLAEFTKRFVQMASGTDWETDGTAIREKGTGRCAIEFVADSGLGYRDDAIKLGLDKADTKLIVMAFDHSSLNTGSVASELSAMFRRVCDPELVEHVRPIYSVVTWNYSTVAVNEFWKGKPITGMVPTKLIPTTVPEPVPVLVEA